MNLLAVNYHYIADTYKPNNAIFPVTTAFLRSQILELKKYFQFLSQTELREIIRSGKNPDGNFCVLTFDDGLKCHYDLALPLLEELRVPAIFYVCGKPLVEQELCLVHKIHQLRANLSETEFREKVIYFLESALGYNSKDIFFHISTKAMLKYRYDTKEAAEVKFLLNMYLKEQEKNTIINNIFNAVFSAERQLALWEELYLSENQVQQLADRDMLGSHTYSHFSLKNLDNKDVEQELKKGKEVLENKFKTKIYSVSYPYGSHFDVDNQTAAVAQALGFEFGFTMERALSANINSPLLLARLDTNDIFGGKKQILLADEQRSVSIKLE